MVIIKINKVAITHLAMEIHFQTTDHVVAVEIVAEQHMEQNCVAAILLKI